MAQFASDARVIPHFYERAVVSKIRTGVGLATLLQFEGQALGVDSICVGMFGDRIASATGAGAYAAGYALTN
jgi:hypothetical protein